jgi:hypothetical protein
MTGSATLHASFVVQGGFLKFSLKADLATDPS